MAGDITQTLCPACGHEVEAHPRERSGSYTCTRTLNELPSCVGCATALWFLDQQNGSSAQEER